MRSTDFLCGQLTSCCKCGVRCIYLRALMMSTNSGLSEAPPTRKPSMSGFLARSRALAAVTEPPYWMRRLLDTSFEMFSASHCLR